MSHQLVPTAFSGPRFTPVLFLMAVFSSTAMTAWAQQFTQQGPKLVGSGAVGQPYQGSSAAVSADGNTALIGGPGPSAGAAVGGAWVFIRSSDKIWAQQGPLLLGDDAVNSELPGPNEGNSVALSADGNTALVGGPYDNDGVGAVWVFSRNGEGTWSQQGTKLVGIGFGAPDTGVFEQGVSVALSADGNTALESGSGGAYVFVRSTTGTWSQQGANLVTTAASGGSVALSGDGNTALLGPSVFVRDGSGAWRQQGSNLVGIGAVGAAYQTLSVALSSDGNTALTGDSSDNGGAGATWVFVRDQSGNWSQEGSKLVGSGAVGAGEQGMSVSLSRDGNTALVGGPGDNGFAGALWVFTRDANGNWNQGGAKLVGSGGVSIGDPGAEQFPELTQGFSVALSADGNTALEGGPGDNGGAGAAWVFARPSGLQFVPLTPCRLVDTRSPAGPFGGPEMITASTRTFNLPSGSCGIPSTALAYSLNVTVVPDAALGYLSIWPAGQSQPIVSTLNSDGRVKANAAIVPAGANGGISVYVSNPTHVILDINGYFVPAGATSAQSFYPLTPCRVADTRNSAESLGGPFLAGGSTRSFAILSSNCGVPSAAQAYSLNFTVVPHVPLGYLSTWPTGETQPLVSTLNTSSTSVTANAAIVPAGNGGAVSVYASNDTDLIIDINGYFAAPGSGGLSLYTVTPCRVLDTRQSSGSPPISGQISVNFEGSSCSLPAAAQAFVVNATVVPQSLLGYISMWPNEESQPLVSTLNASDEAVTSNMAIVPTTNGSIDAFASSATHLILDVSSYFAP